MKIRCLLGSLAVLCLLPISAQSFSSVAIDALFAEWTGSKQPGAAVGVFKDGEVLYQKGYGAANLEHQVPITPKTVFRIGSVSKQFTAACFLLLVRDGKASLEDPLTAYFPDFPSYAKDITMRHLLYHTSGLRDYDQLIQYCPSCDFDSFDDDDMLALVLRQKGLNAPPGAEHIYTNTGYWLLGQIVAQISGQSLGEFAEERLFVPLGMTQSSMLEDYGEVVPHRANGYEEDEEEASGYWWYNTTNAIVGDGGVLSTIEDFKKWDDAYYDRKVLDDEFWELALQTGVLNDMASLSYAAGIECLEYKGRQVQKHNGSAFGFCATYLRVPSEQLSVVILSNRGEGYSIEDKAEAILDMFLRASSAPRRKKSIPAAISYAEIESLAPYVGHYWNAKKYLARMVFQRSDTLYYGPDEERGYPLMPIGERRFRAANGLEFQFSSSLASNQVLTIYRLGKVLSTLTPYVPVTANEQDLASFIGSYWSEELQARYELKADDDKLLWLHDGEVVGALFPIMMDNFQTRGSTNFVFNRDEQGNVTSFAMSNQRMRNLSFVKEVRSK